MRKIVLATVLFVTTLATAQTVQQQNAQPQISVNGEGKITVAPDEAKITIGVENTGKEAAEVKKKNDETVDAVIKYLKSIKLPEKDYQTKRVYLNRNYDYQSKKYSYVATQTITIHLKDLSKYDNMMMGLIDAGVNNIQGVEFISSQMEKYQSEARVKAVADARKKAKDYADALGQKVGKAITVSDNTQSYYPPAMRTMAFKAEASDMPKETLAIGEITITANVGISFSLE